MSMKTDKAIEILETTLYGSPEDVEKYGAFEHAEATREAIKALKREPSTDAVSRSKAIEETLKYRMTSGVTNQGTWNECVDTIARTLADLDALPTVTPERPKGEWIRVDNTKCKCSKCEVIHMIAQYPSGHIDWCPNCGADMREVSECSEENKN